MNTRVDSNPSSSAKTQQVLKERAGFRFGIAGAVMLILALTQLFSAASSGGNHILMLVVAGIGVALVVIAFVKGRR